MPRGREQLIVTLLVLVVLAQCSIWESTTSGGHLTSTIPRWTFALPPGEIVMNPTIDDDLVVVPCNRTVFAFHLLSGSLRWTFQLPIDMNESAGYVSIDAANVYLGLLWHVVALNKSSGEVVWTTRLPLPEKLPFPNRHARADICVQRQRLYVTTFNAPLMEIDIITGAVSRVFTEIGGLAKEHAHCIGDLIIYLNEWPATESNVSRQVALCVNQSTGHVVDQVEDAVNLIVKEGKLFVRQSAANMQTVLVFDVDATSRGGQAPLTLVWKTMQPGLRATFDYFVSGGYLFEATSMINDAFPNNLTAYNLSTGNQLWRRIIGFYYLLAGEDAVFALGTVTVAKAYRAIDGSELWSFDAVGVNDGAVGGNTVVFGTATSIIALRVW